MQASRLSNTCYLDKRVCYRYRNDCDRDVLTRHGENTRNVYKGQPSNYVKARLLSAEFKYEILDTH